MKPFPLKPVFNWQGFSGKQKRCPMCGSWFLPRHREHRYDSNACRQKAYRRKQVRWSGDAAGNVYRNGMWWGVREPPWGRWSYGPVDGIVWKGTGIDHEPATTIPAWRQTAAITHLNEAARCLYAAARTCHPADAKELRKAARELRRRAKAAARARELG